jgi:hypothetical protein
MYTFGQEQAEAEAQTQADLEEQEPQDTMSKKPLWRSHQDR